MPSHPAHWSGADAPILLGMKDLTVVADGFVGCTVTYPVTSNQICYQKDFPKVHIYVTYSNGYTWYSTWTVGGSGWFEISDPEPSGVEPGMPAKGWPTDINCDILPGTAQAASADRIGYATACYVVPPGVL